MENKLVNLSSVRETREATDAWVRQAQQGDMRAFERLYRLFEKRIYALCFRMSSNSAVAEELMQEAFVLAWRKLDTFKGDSQFGTWLHRLTSNLVISHFRVKKNQEVDSLEFEIPSEYNAPEKLQLGRDLERAVAELPTKARMVLVLHDIEGYKHHEIAQQMDISEGTCKAQLHRARQLLKARFE